MTEVRLCVPLPNPDKPHIYFRDGRWTWKARTSHGGANVTKVARFVDDLNLRYWRNLLTGGPGCGLIDP